jgi:N-acetylglucosaminyl-diphospho-decaprenol L-rhamnosyltransferase
MLGFGIVLMVNTARTTIVSVAYNSAGVIGDMLSSVPERTPVIVVDNASADNSADIATTSGALVIRLAENTGFGRGCNVGAVQATSEFLLFLNPDATLGAGCIEKLENAADQYKTASGFNPAITDKDGGDYFKRGSRLLAHSAWMARGRPVADCEVPVLSGAALFCRRAQFEQIGGYDEAIFLYHEDDDLALRLKAAFGPLMFIRAAEVGHQEGRSSPRSPEIAAIKSYHMARSRVYAMKKHGRPFPFWGSLWSGIRKLISPLVLFSPRKRAQALAFNSGVLSTIKNWPSADKKL